MAGRPPQVGRRGVAWLGVARRGSQRGLSFHGGAGRVPAARSLSPRGPLGAGRGLAGGRRGGEGRRESGGVAPVTQRDRT